MAMLFVSGAFRPLNAVHPALAVAMRVIPLTSAVEGYRAALSAAAPPAALFLDLTAQLIFGMLFLYVAGTVIAAKDR